MRNPLYLIGCLYLGFVVLSVTDAQMSALDMLRMAVPGAPNVDYPIYSEVPKTSFSCADKLEGGYYVDVEARCQTFHVCTRGGHHPAGGSLVAYSFLCPNGSLFNQRYFICDWWFNVDCSSSESLYFLNEELFVENGKFPSNLKESAANSQIQLALNARPSSSLGGGSAANPSFFGNQQANGGFGSSGSRLQSGSSFGSGKRVPGSPFLGSSGESFGPISSSSSPGTVRQNGGFSSGTLSKNEGHNFVNLGNNGFQSSSSSTSSFSKNRRPSNQQSNSVTVSENYGNVRNYNSGSQSNSDRGNDFRSNPFSSKQNQNVRQNSGGSRGQSNTNGGVRASQSNGFRSRPNQNSGNRGFQSSISAASNNNFEIESNEDSYGFQSSSQQKSTSNNFESSSNRGNEIGGFGLKATQKFPNSFQSGEGFTGSSFQSGQDNFGNRNKGFKSRVRPANGVSSVTRVPSQVTTSSSTRYSSSNIRGNEGTFGSTRNSLNRGKFSNDNGIHSTLSFSSDFGAFGSTASGIISSSIRPTTEFDSRFSAVSDSYGSSSSFGESSFGSGESSNSFATSEQFQSGRGKTTGNVFASSSLDSYGSDSSSSFKSNNNDGFPTFTTYTSVPSTSSSSTGFGKSSSSQFASPTTTVSSNRNQFLSTTKQLPSTLSTSYGSPSSTSSLSNRFTTTQSVLQSTTSSSFQGNYTSNPFIFTKSDSSESASPIVVTSHGSPTPSNTQVTFSTPFTTPKSTSISSTRNPLENQKYRDELIPSQNPSISQFADSSFVPLFDESINAPFTNDVQSFSSSFGPSQVPSTSYGIPLADPIAVKPTNDPVESPSLVYGVPLADPIAIQPQESIDVPSLTYGVPLAEPISSPVELPSLTYGVPLADPISAPSRVTDDPPPPPPPSSYGVPLASPSTTYDTL